LSIFAQPIEIVTYEVKALALWARQCPSWIHQFFIKSVNEWFTNSLIIYK